MTQPKPKTVGTTIEVPEGAQVIRPADRGTVAAPITVTGGLYVFDVPGTYTIDGTEHTVTA